jgi:hypothetical protein
MNNQTRLERVRPVVAPFPLFVSTRARSRSPSAVAALFPFILRTKMRCRSFSLESLAGWQTRCVFEWAFHVYLLGSKTVLSWWQPRPVSRHPGRDGVFPVLRLSSHHTTTASHSDNSSLLSFLLSSLKLAQRYTPDYRKLL